MKLMAQFSRSPHPCLWKTSTESTIGSFTQSMRRVAYWWSKNGSFSSKVKPPMTSRIRAVAQSQGKKT